MAGLAAIGAAGALGAIVRATDPRPEVADQVSSLGGEYLSISSPEVEVSTTGYAKEMGDDYKAREAQLYADQCKDVDIIITTALIPGRPAPRMITAEMVASMKPGSVIVDMAAANGGNVEGTVRRPEDRHVERRHDHRLHRPGGPAARAGEPALRHQPGQPDEAAHPRARTARLVLDFDDVVQRSMTVVRDGEKTWPPPPVSVSAAPAAAPAAVAPVGKPARTSSRTVPGRAGSASSARPRPCCSWSRRCRRPR